MTLVRVKGFKIFKDRHGKRRCYHRATGTPVDLDRFPMGTAGFLSECERIRNMMGRADTLKPGTLGLLIERQRADKEFRELSDRTRHDYQLVCDYLKPIAKTPLARINKPLVVKIRDRAAELHGWRFGLLTTQFLSRMFGWADERGYIKGNPAAGIKRQRKPRGAPEANRPWTDEERHAVMDALPGHMIVPVALMMYCGLDPQDALRLSRASIADGHIDTQRGKTEQPVWVPLPSPVVDVLKAAPSHDAITVCANSYGKPWTLSGFRASWRPVRMGLEESGKVGKGLTMKGLRHTVATILREMGEGERAIADMLGQKTTTMARHYSRRADLKKNTSAIVKRFEDEVNKRGTKIVKPSE